MTVWQCTKHVPDKSGGPPLSETLEDNVKRLREPCSWPASCQPVEGQDLAHNVGPDVLLGVKACVVRGTLVMAGCSASPLANSRLGEKGLTSILLPATKTRLEERNLSAGPVPSSVVPQSSGHTRRSPA